jgi:hypothetical protein
MPFISRPAAGQIIDPAWGTLVADAVVMRFATAAQRTSQLVAPVTGQLTMLDTAVGVVEVWTGTAWIRQGPGQVTELLPADLAGVSGAVIVPGTTVALPNVAARRHLVTATGTVRKQDALIATAQIWLEAAAVRNRQVAASMSANFSVPWIVRYTYVNRPGVSVSLGASCDTGLASLLGLTVTVDDMGPQ